MNPQIRRRSTQGLECKTMILGMRRKQYQGKSPSQFKSRCCITRGERQGAENSPCSVSLNCQAQHMGTGSEFRTVLRSISAKAWNLTEHRVQSFRGPWRLVRLRAKFTYWSFLSWAGLHCTPTSNAPRHLNSCVVASAFCYQLLTAQHCPSHIDQQAVSGIQSPLLSIHSKNCTC